MDATAEHDVVPVPFAKSSGKVLALLRALKAKGGDQKANLFQFLNTIGARALRIHLGRVLEMAESSSNKGEYKRKINEWFGRQQEFQFVIPPQEEIEAVYDLALIRVPSPGVAGGKITLRPHSHPWIAFQFRQYPGTRGEFGESGMLIIAICRKIVRVFVNRYRPELHYMRGPGPKWVERHRPSAANANYGMWRRPSQ